MWDEIVGVVHRDYPDVQLERILVDAAAAYMVSSPGRFDVVVASNLFGDILTDIGAVIQGGMGMAASANIRPDRSRPGMFEPVHGSAPDIAGTGRANPVGAVWAGAMMLDHLGEPAASSAVMKALEEVLAATGIRTPGRDGCGTPDTPCSSTMGSRGCAASTARTRTATGSSSWSPSARRVPATFRSSPDIARRPTGGRYTRASCAPPWGRGVWLLPAGLR
jgi:isocitrate/isopropylmalate dehydrogenase